MTFPSLIRIIKWLFLTWFYFSLLSYSAGWILIYLIPTFILSFRAYQMDLLRERNVDDSFRDNNLFFRYGRKIDEQQFRIPVNQNSEDEIKVFVIKMMETMLAKLKDKLIWCNTDAISIKDDDLKEDIKRFGRIIFETKRGTRLSHFFHYSICGQAVISYYYTYFRGVYKWHDIFNFVFCAPVSWVLWLISWLNNQFSIIASISNNVSNSFDTIDWNTYEASSRYIMLDELRIFLKDEGILTEELAQVFNQTINNFNNSQNVSVDNSPGAILDNITNMFKNEV